MLIDRADDRPETGSEQFARMPDGQAVDPISAGAAVVAGRVPRPARHPCRACRYNLRDCRADHCPECGLPFRLTVVTAQPARGPWLVRLLAFALPLGFNGIMAIAATIGALWSAHWQAGDWLRLALVWAIAIGAAVGVARVVRGWASFVRLSPLRQRDAACITAVAMAVLPDHRHHPPLRGGMTVMPQTITLEQIRIASPVSRDSMQGDDRRRYCSLTPGRIFARSLSHRVLGVRLDPAWPLRRFRRLLHGLAGSVCKETRKPG